jgi:hypothetical protein
LFFLFFLFFLCLWVQLGKVASLPIITNRRGAFLLFFVPHHCQEKGSSGYSLVPPLFFPFFGCF